MVIVPSLRLPGLRLPGLRLPGLRLRTVLTPTLGPMPMCAVLLALVGGTVVFGYLGIRTFTNRVLN